MYEKLDNPFAEKYLVIAEKPSVARTIAYALGCREKKEGYTYNTLPPDIKRLLNSKNVTDHHAIIPTVMIRNTDLSVLRDDEKNILILIAARLVCATGKNHIYETVKAAFLCCGYTFTATGRNVKEAGWKAVENAMHIHCHAAKEDTNDSVVTGSEIQDLSSLYQGAQFAPVNTKVTDHWTQPPKQFTEDTLLHAMEVAGAAEMESDVDRKGLGTPATRAGIIEKLVISKYAVRNKRHIIVTEAGRQLISVLPDYLKSAKMTADWENQLLQIERGQYSRKAFLDGITQMIRRIIQDCQQLDDDERNRFGGQNKTNAGRPERESLGKCPLCGSPVYEGDKVFYCSDKNCHFILWKENRFLTRMRICLDDGMVKDLLANGRTHVKDLYSQKKDKFFSADLLMEWKDGKARFSLDFTNASTGRNGS
ncbi:MAG: DNA topoisomerase [Eubacteriales bacterium]|nr:DNA topoisomerase [Eubacteriales bacterium]